MSLVPINYLLTFMIQELWLCSNVCAALNEGIRKFDACIAGLGGCPFAPGAAGNLATEDICNMLEQMGYQTNINLNKLNSIVDFCAEKLDAQVGGCMTPGLEKLTKQVTIAQHKVSQCIKSLLFCHVRQLNPSDYKILNIS